MGNVAERGGRKDRKRGKMKAKNEQRNWKRGEILRTKRLKRSWKTGKAGGGRKDRESERQGKRKSYSGNNVVAMEMLSSVRLLHRCLVGIFKGLQGLVELYETERTEY